ncbi:MAG: DUF1593 domain-containing protein, partial [Betaproteobacteria bacterium]|nr:DUF1593 domain-containing protein [Betaproteobacteria bacterium]
MAIALGGCSSRGFFAFFAFVTFGTFASIVTAQHQQCFLPNRVACHRFPWGGQSTIARALKSIEDEFKNTKDWALIKQKVSNKTVLLPSGDQDNTYASYIKPNWPAIDYRQYKNGPNYGYGAQLSANAVNASVLTADWMQKNISS